MNKVRKASALSVKRAYLVADAVRRSSVGTDFLGPISVREFRTKLALAKKKILALPEKKLDLLIHKAHPPRLRAFDSADWYYGTFSPHEAGVWRRAGKLPLEWTNGTLEETAEHVKKAMETKSKRLKNRAKSAIPNILRTNVDLIQKEKYLLPIIFESGTGTNGRGRLRRKTTGDIDDGCMRSIALAIHGATRIKAYIGFSKE
jgi:hypothetical protein